jgi:hypothetical protein
MTPADLAPTGITSVPGASGAGEPIQNITVGEHR